MTAGLSFIRGRNFLGFVFNQSREKIGFLTRTATTSVYHQKDKSVYIQDEGKGTVFSKRFNHIFDIAYKYRINNSEGIGRNKCNFYHSENFVVQKEKKYVDSHFISCAQPIFVSREGILNSISKSCNNTKLINGVYNPFRPIPITKTHFTNTELISKRHYSQNVKGFDIHKRISSLKVKKRVQRKKKLIEDDTEEGLKSVEGFESPARHKFLTFDPEFTLPEIPLHKPPPREWQVTAYATGDEYDLEGLLDGLTEQGLYRAASLHQGNDHMHALGRRSKAVHSIGRLNSPSADLGPDATDVLHMVASYQIDSSNREIYFFREGSAVFWNVSEIERKNVLRFLKKFEKGEYDKEIVDEESESLSYTFSETSAKTKLVKDRITLNAEGQTDLEKYTFSNALAQSVKLGIWEANLDKYIDNIEYVSEELREQGRVVLSQEEVLQRLGQLFALRHLINLSSDLLDIPDFYWDHPELELLYKKTCNHLSITQRTTVMNEKINHCLELMELLKSSLSEAHSARLEWIIIILIMVEVGFELLHVIERYI